MDVQATLMMWRLFLHHSAVGDLYGVDFGSAGNFEVEAFVASEEVGIGVEFGSAEVEPFLVGVKFGRAGDFDVVVPLLASEEVEDGADFDEAEPVVASEEVGSGLSTALKTFFPKQEDFVQL